MTTQSAHKMAQHDRPKRASSFIKTRHLIALLATLCPVVCYISRQNLSMAIMAMVDSERDSSMGGAQPAGPANSSLDQVTIEPYKQQASEPAGLGTCPRPRPVRPAEPGPQQSEPATSAAGQQSAKFHWTSNQCNLVLGAFFWTYVIFQIPAARFAERLGAKWVLAAAGIGSSLLSLLSPWCASVSVYGLFAARALMGICQTALYPACYVLYSKWLPPVERSQALPILSVGAYLGSIVATSSTGYFIQEAAYGWSFAFYMPGLLCAIWSLAWLAYGSSEPRQHCSISLEELDYIESKMELKRTGAEPEPTSSKQRSKQISWLKLAKSGQIWAMIAAFFASNWSFAILLLLLPSYLGEILHVEPLDNGMINSSLYVLFCIATPIAGSVSTMMVETRPFGISRLNVRKVFQGLALYGQSVCFALLPLIGCQTKLVVATLFVQIVLFSCINGGEVQLPTELSVDFSGTIYAIGNCVGSSTGFIVPAVSSLIIANRSERAQWNQFFYVAALVSSFGASLFMVFGRNQLTDYSKDPEDFPESCSPNNNHNNHNNKAPKSAKKSTTSPATLNIYKPGHRNKFNVEKSSQHFDCSLMDSANGGLKGHGLACKSWRQRPEDLESGKLALTMTTQW